MAWEPPYMYAWGGLVAALVGKKHGSDIGKNHDVLKEHLVALEGMEEAEKA